MSDTIWQALADAYIKGAQGVHDDHAKVIDWKAEAAPIAAEYRNQLIRELIEKAKEIGASIHSPEFVTTDRSTGEAVLYSADLADWLKAQMTEGE